MKSVLRSICVSCSVALAALPATQPSQAQQGAAGVTYSIPAGNLSTALTRWAQLSGYKLLAPGDVLKGRTSPGLSGSYAPQQALSALLAGSGLSYAIEGTTVTVSDPSADNAGATIEGAIALDTINVSGGGGAAAEDLPYETPGSSAYISQQQIERFPGSTSGDIFKSTPGVIASGNHSGGASMDVNIRGMQGQNRVKVSIDGTQQTATTSASMWTLT